MNKAKEMVGKRVLIGLTHYGHDGKLLNKTEMHGKIVSVNPNSVKVELEGFHKGETFSLPRALRAFKKAEPGTYRLHSTEEEVVNPDYTTTWEIIKRAPEEGEQNKK